jgi:type II secretory ATPase GspE/PulE/Tfp pilus assembly ATPase PilB-like protein
MAGGLRLDEIGWEPQDLATVRRLLGAPAGLVLLASPRRGGAATTDAAMRDAIERAHRRAEVLVLARLETPRAVERALLAVESGRLVLARVLHDRACGVLALMHARRADPIRLADALALIVAQRLLPKLCPRCARDDPRDESRRLLAQAASTWLAGRVPRPLQAASAACPHCGSTGYAGRLLAYEMVEVDARARGLIATGAGRTHLEHDLLAEGCTLWERGLRHLADGLTSMEALLGSIREPR